MFIIDDILTAPFKGLMWVFQEIGNAAREEQAATADNLTQELTQLYLLLEAGKVTEAEFEAREQVLLDRLEQIQEASRA